MHQIEKNWEDAASGHKRGQKNTTQYYATQRKKEMIKVAHLESSGQGNVKLSDVGREAAKFCKFQPRKDDQESQKFFEIIC